MTIALRAMLMGTLIHLLACGASASPSPEASAPEATPPQADVAWDDRVDFEEWTPTLLPGQEFWPTEPPSRWPELRARLVLPAAVTPGETVDYVVVLRNIADVPVDLRPCGGYEQEVMGVRAGLSAEAVPGGTSTFRLSCDTEPILLPAASRRYAMRLVVPPNLTGDEALFRWGFVDNMPDYDAQLWVGLLPR